MKLLAVLAGFIALSSGGVIPLVPRNSSHYEETESRYIWIPDGDGVPHLEDLHAPVDEEILKTRNGANNQYWLYTRQNPTSPQFLIMGNVNSVRNSNYRATRPTNVIVHGLNGNGNAAINPTIRDAFLNRVDCNVIVVDWSALANSGYSTAVAGVPGVGQFLGNFLRWLVVNFDGNWNQIHLVGHSLGAHIVGNAGRTADRRIVRITGLDPAGPRWQGNSLALNSQDGVYVEAIHTDGQGLGIYDRVANADFYPNGGRNPQPGCLIATCSHSRAWELFASTVRNGHLVGRLCTNIIQAQVNQCAGSNLVMGTHVLTKRGNGIYGLTTGRAWPF